MFNIGYPTMKRYIIISMLRIEYSKLEIKA